MEQNNQKDNIQYHWGNSDKFEINGQLLQILIGTFRAVTNTEDAQKIIASKVALDTLENIVQEGVKDGKIRVTKNGEPVENTVIKTTPTKATNRTPAKKKR